MSEWRDIWKRSMVANSKLVFDEADGENEILQIKEQFDLDEDGMLNYARAEAFELLEKYDEAKEEYAKARQLFPVPHWKEVCRRSIERIESQKKAEDYFDLNDFYDYLWFVYHKVYEFVYLNDFVRYVCLSALSRGSSEWPLSLVDFRTVLEMQINALLPDYDESDDNNRDNLRDRIDDLKYYGIVTDEELLKAMHWVRKNGNKATHQIKNIGEISQMQAADLRLEIRKLESFYKVLEFFNTYNKSKGTK